MKKFLLLNLFLFTVLGYSQNLSKTHIIYENKDTIVLNNGEKYAIVMEKPYYYIYDSSIKQFREINEKILKLNRLLIIKNNTTYKQLIEWTEKDLTYYECNTIYLKNAEESFGNELESISTN